MKSTLKLFASALILLSVFACSIEESIEDAIPAQPMALNATATSDVAVELSWAPVEEASWYKIFYAVEGETLEVEANYQDLQNNPITYTIDGLTAETNYEFTIEATAYQDDGDVLAEGTATATTNAGQ